MNEKCGFASDVLRTESHPWQDFWFSQRCCRRSQPSAMWRRVTGQVVCDVSVSSNENTVLGLLDSAAEDSDSSKRRELFGQRHGVTSQMSLYRDHPSSVISRNIQ